jgi:hypothetical protein
MFATLNAATAIPAASPVQTSTVNTDVAPRFPTGITFTARIPVEPGTDVTGASLYYRIGSDETLNMATVPRADVVVEGDSVAVSLFVDLQTAYIPLGVALTYFWELTDQGEVVLSSAEESTLWIDTRFDWQTHSSSQVTIYTYGMSADFAQWMLEGSQATIDDLEQRYGLDAIDPVAIWIYPEAEDFAGTRQVNTREAIAGISYPGASVIAAVIPDGSEREYGRVVPHEISHQVLYHATENPYAFPPLWLDEGLATHYQTGGTDHYAGMVWRAQEEGKLFDITSLNASFPFQPAQATLAYASSWSMVGYIETTYGPDGISRLIEAFGEGMPVDDAVERALGISTTQLNADWHQWIAGQGKPVDAAA